MRKTNIYVEVSINAGRTVEGNWEQYGFVRFSRNRDSKELEKQCANWIRDVKTKHPDANFVVRKEHEFEYV